MLMLVFIFVIFVIVIVATIWKIHTISTKWKSTISLILTIVSIFFFDALRSLEMKEVIEKNQKSVIDSIKVVEERLMASQEEIKQLIRSQQQGASTMHDSILTKIALLDTCIDKHFYRVNARLLDINKRLDER